MPSVSGSVCSDNRTEEDRMSRESRLPWGGGQNMRVPGMPGLIHGKSTRPKEHLRHTPPAAHERRMSALEVENAAGRSPLTSSTP